MLIEDQQLRNQYSIFKSRRSAGFLLGPYISLENIDVMYIIPRGGIPVGLGILEFPLVSAKTIFNLLIIRKIQVPRTTEAGMGAITPNGQVYLNETLISQLSVENSHLELQIERATQEIEKRRRELQFTLNLPNVYGKKVLLVDDGIASGFSMIAGAKWLKQQGAEEIVISVPTAPISSIRLIEPHVEKIICLNVRTQYPFAVADAYQDWYDLDNKEAKYFLQQMKIIGQMT